MSNPRTGQPLRGEELWRWVNMQEVQGHYDDRGPTDGGRPLAGYHHGYGHWDNGPGYGGDNVERSSAGQARPEEYSPSLRRGRSPQRYQSGHDRERERDDDRQYERGARYGDLRRDGGARLGHDAGGRDFFDTCGSGDGFDRYRRDRDSHHERSHLGRSGGGSGERNRREGVVIPAGREPPARAEQLAIRKALEAQQEARGDSEAVKAHLERRPNPYPKAGEELTDEVICWQLGLHKLRAGEDESTPPTAWYGRLGHLKPSSELKPGTRLPVGHSDWRNPLQPRQFPEDSTVSDMDYFRRIQQKETMLLEGITLTTARDAGKLPAQITNSIQYYKQSGSLGVMMFDSGRFDRAEHDAHLLYIADIMKLMEDYDCADVMLYDDDFRLRRHLLQDGLWAKPDEELLQKRVREPHLRRAAAKPAVKPPKPPKRPGAKPPKPGAGGNLTWNAWDRPAYKHKEIDGKNVCRNWLWGGCSDACSHTKYNSREPAPLTHKCSYCQGDHRLTECDLFKAEQPADFAKGKSG